jgi:hypothetical protein
MGALPRRRRLLGLVAREILIERTHRIGVQTVEREGNRYFLTIRNRTYRSVVEVPVETARRYYRVMRGEK